MKNLLQTHTISLDRFELGPVIYAAWGVTALVFIGGFLLVALGWRADTELP